uniref:Uncharacterized protein n=1 Tax=Nelumbo nucifera TaxID=4432 RepID=A0A822YZR5_NELNU|nr:TPA_asm: hypothetical protein HUJ06_007356 [Nelumbo nucifera]
MVQSLSLSLEHKRRLQETPFGHFLDLPQFTSDCGAGSSKGSSSYSGYLFGCSAMLMAWLYEHTTLFSPSVLDASPRLF